MLSPELLPLVIAHRGASGYRPEHSRAAYLLAISMGADAVEPDLVASRDGVLVVRHENEISGTTDVSERPEFADRQCTRSVDGQTVTGWFTEDFTWAELSTLRVRERLPQVRPGNTRWDGEEPILRFRDLLALVDAAPRRVGVVAEIKHATHFASLGLPLDELFAAELAAAGWLADDRLMIESFEQSVLHRIRARGVVAPLIYLFEDSGTAVDEHARHGDAAPSYAQQLAELVSFSDMIEGISVPKGMLVHEASGQLHDTGLVQRAHDAGLRILCWTLRPENRFLPAGLRTGKAGGTTGRWRDEWSAIMRTGVDGVFADHPDLAITVRRELPEAVSEADPTIGEP